MSAAISQTRCWRFVVIFLSVATQKLSRRSGPYLSELLSQVVLSPADLYFSFPDLSTDELVQAEQLKVALRDLRANIFL